MFGQEYEIKVNYWEKCILTFQHLHFIAGNGSRATWISASRARRRNTLLLRTTMTSSTPRKVPGKNDLLPVKATRERVTADIMLGKEGGGIIPALVRSLKHSYVSHIQRKKERLKNKSEIFNVSYYKNKDNIKNGNWLFWLTLLFSNRNKLMKQLTWHIIIKQKQHNIQQ